MTNRSQAAFSRVREQQEHRERSGIVLDGKKRMTLRYDEAGEEAGVPAHRTLWVKKR